MLKYGSLYLFNGALNKSNIYIFVPNSIENLQINKYQTFLADSSNEVSLYWPLVNSIISRVSNRLLYFLLFIEADFEKKEMQEIFIFLQK